MSMATMERRRALVGSRRRRNQNANRSRGQNTRNGRGTPRSRRRFGCQRSRKGGGAPIIQLNNIFPPKKSERVPSQVPPVGLSFFSKKEFAARKIFVINTLKSFLLDRTVSNMSVPVGLRVGFFFSLCHFFDLKRPKLSDVVFFCVKGAKIPTNDQQKAT